MNTIMKRLGMENSTLETADAAKLRKKVKKRTLLQFSFIAFIVTAIMEGLNRINITVLVGWVAHMIYGDGWVSD